MKAFVSGQLKEREKIREVFAKLAALGIEVTHDWTTTDDMPKNYAKNAAEAGIRAKRDIDGVRNADFYILMTDNEFLGRGMYVELGAALSLAETRGSPKVYVVGPRNHESIFYYHPLATHFADIDSCLDHIKTQQ